MPTVHSVVPLRMGKVDTIVRRCGCSPSAKEDPNWHGWIGEACPHPRAIEDHGTTAYWHRNPLKRVAYRIKRALRWLVLGGTDARHIGR